MYFASGERFAHYSLDSTVSKQIAVQFTFTHFGQKKTVLYQQALDWSP